MTRDWHFASADAATVRRLADEVGFTWVASPGGFDHVAQVTILDADGRVVQQVYGAGVRAAGTGRAAQALVLRRAVGRLSVRGLIERVKLFCSVYDPASGGTGSTTRCLPA